MEEWMQPVGLGVSLAGALILGLADAWLSRSILIYLDAIESNVSKLVDSLRSGSTDVIVTSIDIKRDRRQNQVRFVKTLGWMTLATGIALQFAKLYLPVPPV